MLEIIIDYMKKNWNFSLRHILSEGNVCANILVLAKFFFFFCREVLAKSGPHCIDISQAIIVSFLDFVSRRYENVLYFFFFWLHENVLY